MQQLTRADIWSLPEYEPRRAAFRKEIIALKQRRRVSVGDRITFVFESRETLRFQIQEMMRIEHLNDEAKIAEEIATYNALIPEEGELSATTFIEIEERDQIRPVLERLHGIDSSDAVWMEVGTERLPGLFEEGRSTDEKLSAVQYVRFRFTPTARAAFLEGQAPIRLVIDHPHYRASTLLTEATRQALAEDLREPVTKAR
ncbi:MAG: DUF3501 family protein [Nitrospirae bacterium]|nr:DUF3501 family protein [Nitrospirota bacterium]